MYIYVYMYIYIYIYIHIYTHTHTHIPDCVSTVHESPFLPDNTASETFLHKSRAMRSADWIFIIKVPA